VTSFVKNTLTDVNEMVKRKKCYQGQTKYWHRLRKDNVTVT